MPAKTLNPRNDYELLALYAELRRKHNLPSSEETDPPTDPDHAIAIEIMRIVHAAGGQDLSWADVQLMIRQAEADAQEG